MKKIINIFLLLLMIFGLSFTQSFNQSNMITQANADSFISLQAHSTTEFSIGEIEGFSVYTNSNNWQGNEIIVFMSVPEGVDATTISGDVFATRMTQITDGIGVWNLLSSDVGDVIFEGYPSITIAPGETKVIARIAAGNPMSWRAFYQPVDIHLLLKFTATVGSNQAVEAITNVFSTFPYHESIKLYDPDTAQLWNIYDDDLVFFAGDSFRMDFTGFPTGWDTNIGPTFEPAGTGYPTARVYFMVSIDGGPPVYGTGEAKILEEAQQDENGRWYMDFEEVNGTMSVVGTVADNLPQVALGYEIHLYASNALKTTHGSNPAFNDHIQVGPRPIIYEEGAIEESWDYRLIFFGIEIPEFDGLTVSPNLSELGNLYETEEALTLSNPTKAIITFDPGINIMGVFNHTVQEGGIRYFEDLVTLQDNIEVIADTTNNILSTQINTSSIQMLDGFPATIQFLKASQRLGLPAGVLTQENMFTYLTVAVFDNQQLVTDISSYIDVSLMTYDQTLDKLTIPVNHFTKYQIGLTPLGKSMIATAPVPTSNYNIIMHTNCGRPSSSINQLQGTQLVLPTPTRIGYEFDGWYWDKGFSMRFTETTMPIGDVDIYANWSLKQQVTYIEKEDTTKVKVGDLKDKILLGDLTQIEAIGIELDVTLEDILLMQRLSRMGLAEHGLKLIVAYNIELIKSLTMSQEAPIISKVKATDILDEIKVYIPVLSGVNPNSLTVVYIKPDGVVQLLESEVVIEGGVTYLAFYTRHFSYYGLAQTDDEFEDVEETTPPTSDHQSYPWILLVGLLMIFLKKQQSTKTSI